MDKIILDQCIETAQLFSVAAGIEAIVIDGDGKSVYAIKDQACANCVCDCVPKQACIDSHRFGAQQSLMFGGAYIFFCPVGLVHFISPIIIRNELVGALLCGHFLMTEPDVYLIRHILKYVEDDKTLKEFVQNVQVVEPKKVKAMSELLGKLASQISDGSQVVKKGLDHYNLSEAKHHHCIHKVMNHIKENYMLKISLEEVALQVHFTPQYLSKIFKEETGTTFKQYLAATRVEKSKKLLAQMDMTHSEVAYLVGFSDQSHFSKTFKKVTGMSPSTYVLGQASYQ